MTVGSVHDEMFTYATFDGIFAQTSADAGQRIREESVQRYRITRGAAQPVDFGRGIAVDPDQ
jgi:hypothetical protein